MTSILSTKILTPEQKKPLLEAGFRYREHDFIQIQHIEFEAPPIIENAIFTSQNTVKAIRNSHLKIQNCYCVGTKTKALLEADGFHVIAQTEYGKDLAAHIVDKAADKRFVFFCGNRRRDEMPSLFKRNKIQFEEIEVYKTKLNPLKIDSNFDGVLFFSPSGIQSFYRENTLKNEAAFCIGTTTAKEAEKHTKNIIIATHTTIESVVEGVMNAQN